MKNKLLTTIIFIPIIFGFFSCKGTGVPGIITPNSIDDTSTKKDISIEYTITSNAPCHLLMLYREDYFGAKNGIIVNETLYKGGTVTIDNYSKEYTMFHQNVIRYFLK